MKKMLAALCAFLLLFTAGCGNDDNAESDSIDIAALANSGSMSGAAYKIGDAVPQETEGDTEKFFVDDGAASFFSTGDFNFYYDKTAESPTIYAIAAFSNCYGFDVGAILIEITKELEAQGIGFTARDPAAGEIFFLPSGENRSVVECASLSHKLLFVFENNALCAAVIF